MNTDRYQDSERQRAPLPDISAEMLQAMRQLRDDVEQDHQLIKELHKQTHKELHMNGIRVEYSLTNEIEFVCKRIAVKFVGYDITQISYREKLPATVAVYDIFLTSGVRPASILEKKQHGDEIVFVYRD